MAGLLAIDTARTALQIKLDDIVARLVVTHESGIGMSGSPDTDHRNGSQRSQMHIGRVHRQHHIEVTHHDEFLIHVFTIARNIGALTILGTPETEVFILLLTLSEEEDATPGVFLQQLMDHLLHQSWGIDLAFVVSKGCDAYPLLEVLLRSDLLGQQV